MTDDYCEVMDGPRDGCGHCRERGFYKPPEGAIRTGMSLANTESLTVEIDVAGLVWISSDEAFLRGKLGKGLPGIDNDS